MNHGGVTFRVLGTLQVSRAGRSIAIKPTKLRVLLAVLLLNAGHPVPVSRIIDRLWSDALPSDARRAVQLYVVRLRRLLGQDGLISTCTDGYQIDVNDDALDLNLFKTLLAKVRKVRHESPRQAAIELVDTAISLWRGPALADVPSEALHRLDVPALTERWLEAVELRNDLYIEAGRHAEMVSDLRTWTTRFPFRERMWSQLLIALDHCSRRGEALLAYQAAARLLSEELGIDPGTELTNTYMQILTNDGYHLPRIIEGPSTVHT